MYRVVTLPLLCVSPVQTAVSALEEGAGEGMLEMSIDRPVGEKKA